jgi:raffinose/stachyose/melibiose transport system permease protein
MVRSANYRKDPVSIVCFLAPMLLIYTLLEVVPVIASFYFSFFSWKGIYGVPLKYVGLKNFFNLFKSWEFLLSLKNIFWYVLLSILTQIPVGFLVAFILFHLKKGVRLFKALFFIPMILPVTAFSLLWRFILFPNADGVLNGILMSLGLIQEPIGWLIEKNTAMNCIVAITTWASYGYYMIIGYAALTGIPQEILEAATVDGANEWQRTFHIMLPMLWEPLKLSVIMVITGVLKIFDLVYVMTGGGPNGLTHVPATLMYQEAFYWNHFGAGSAIAVIMFVLSMSATLVSLWLMRRERLEY